MHHTYAFKGTSELCQTLRSTSKQYMTNEKCEWMGNESKVHHFTLKCSGVEVQEVNAQVNIIILQKHST